MFRLYHNIEHVHQNIMNTGLFYFIFAGEGLGDAVILPFQAKSIHILVQVE